MEPLLLAFKLESLIKPPLAGFFAYESCLLALLVFHPFGSIQSQCPPENGSFRDLPEDSLICDRGKARARIQWES